MTHGHLLAGSEAIPYHVGHGEGAVRMTRQAGTVAVDIETAGLGVASFNVRSVQVGTPDEAYVLHPDFDRQAIIDCIEAADRLVFHNSPFDVPILIDVGLMAPASIPKVFDTLIASRQAAPSEIGGHDLAAAYARHVPDRQAGNKKALHEAWRARTGQSKAQMFTSLDITDEAFCQYAANDAVMTAQLAERLPEAMRKHTTDHPFRSSGDPDYLLLREQTLNHMFLDAQVRGISVDLGVIDELTVELGADAAIADAVLMANDINIEELSPVKVKEAVMDALDALGSLPANYPRLLNGRPTAAAGHRMHLSHPILEALDVRSRALRFVKDYAEKLLPLAERDGRIHPQVAVATAVTGRMSMKDPPLQQYPAGVRRMLRFDTMAVSMDWSSIEPVLFANLAGEVGMVAEFEAGGDLYEPVARAAGVSRKTAKVILLAQFYGQGVRKLAWSLGVDEDEAKRLISRVMGPLEAIGRATKAISGIGATYGKTQTLSGRICPIAPDFERGNHRFRGYLAVNYVVQGGAYDLLAEAIYEMHRRGLDDALYVAVHDELVVAADAAHDVEEIMRTPPPVLVEKAGRVPVLRVGRSDLGLYWKAKEG